MAVYPLPDRIKKRRNDLIASEDQHRKDLCNLPAGFLLPPAALTNISKKLALSHLTCFSTAHMRACRKQGHIESMYVSDKPFRCLLLSIWHSSTPGSASLFTCVQLSPQIVLTWCHLPVLNASAPCSTSVCKQNVYKYMQKSVQTSSERPHFSLLLCFNVALSGSPG